MNDIIVTTPDELKEIISESVETALDAHSKKESESEEDLMKPNEVAKLLQVSIVTLYHWTNQKKLKAYKIGRRKFFKKHEVIEALHRINK